MSIDSPSPRDRRGRVYTPAIGPRLKPLLWTVLGGFALLGANGVYLASITVLAWFQHGVRSETFFYYLMFILHLVLGFALVLPFIAFGMAHLATSWKRPNKAAVRYGLALLAASIVLLISGLVLVRIGVFEVRDPTIRAIGYWLHVGTPLLAIALYVRHRLAGPRIRWEWARAFGGVVTAFVVLMAVFHSYDPRSGLKPNDPSYTFPSELKLADGKLIPAQSLMMDDYCLKCHKDAYEGWFHSAHHFSSFNNPAYRFSVRETRRVSMERDGNTRASRWCAGCHDIVPFVSGEMDDPNYDDVNAPSSQAGITCVTCHAITHVNSTRGNGDFTIAEPEFQPFAFSEDPILQWINTTLVKAKPEQHKRTFLKPEVHRSSKFCSTCHKVGLPFALNHYKDFLRGQNHYDTHWLSGVSGGGARSFYYPPPDQKAKQQCADCHMGLVASDDFGARDFDGKPGREIHDHLFLGANTGLATFRGRPDVAKRHEDFLKDKKVRIDVFGLRRGGGIDGDLIAPLRPEVPTLKPGEKYLVETVVRTLGLGHPFSQGTADSNEIWVELIAKADGRIIGRSGGIGPDDKVDPWSHFINIYMLDRHGNRIDRRNPQDIFVPLYNKQVPPGAGQVVHFSLDVPSGVRGPITLEAKVNYRKFDRTYLDYVFGPSAGPELPVIMMARDVVTLPVEGGPTVKNEPSPIKETWQRWNDYGIGLFLEGADKGGQKGELKQAEPVFLKVAELGRADGWVNLARVYQREGRIPDALKALEKAANHKEPAAPWTINWLTGQINVRNSLLDEAIANFESVLSTKVPARGFDFGRDYEVINSLGDALWLRSRQEDAETPERLAFVLRTIEAYRRTLAIDSENVIAHYGLGLAYAELAYSAAPVSTKVEGAVTDKIVLEQAEAVVAPGSDRKAKAVELAGAIKRFVAGPRPEFGSRTEPLHKVIERLGPECSKDAAARAGLALALEAAHKSLHAMLKADDTAEGQAIARHRQANPAADHNAQSIVIHDLHRPGAPGIDDETKTATNQHAAREVRP